MLWCEQFFWLETLQTWGKLCAWLMLCERHLKLWSWDHDRRQQSAPAGKNLSCGSFGDTLITGWNSVI